jgi:CHAT domain-containing protein
MYQRNLKSVGPKHPRTALTQGFYAMSLQEQGHIAEAKKHFTESLPILVEQVRNDSENQTSSLKSQKRFAMLVESYVAVLFSEAKSNESVAKDLIAEAFKYADMARASSVQRALTQSTARLNIKDSKLEKLARLEQDLQRRINSLSELLVALSAASPERQLPTIQAKLKQDIDSLKLERVSVKKEIEYKYPEYFDLVEPKPITVARTTKTLKSDEVLVTWYFGDRQSYVWAIHSNGIAGYAQLPVTREVVAKDVEKLRKALDPGVSTVDEIPPFDVALSYRLYTQLIKPVEGALVQKNLLISIPHANLGQLPISTLLTEPMKQPSKGALGFAGYQNAPWLIRRIAISQLPSVNALAALRSVATAKSDEQSFIAFADPIFSKQQAIAVAKQSLALATRGIPLRLRNAPKTSKVSSAELAMLPALPDTSIEVGEIAKVLGVGEGSIFVHEKASIRQVLETDFSKKSIVMFSTHGLVPGELDGLTQPALALSSPEVTGETDTDGLLTMDKILELKLNADWVVLSACNTASTDGNSEAVSGLGRAFFYAGARALLVSNWPVDTVASRQLMTDLFKKQSDDKKLSKPEALRQAMLTLADKGGYRDGKLTSGYAYAHPLFWAPFVVVGD